jgi:hypothetical protein
VNGKETSADEKMQLNDELTDLFWAIDEFSGELSASKLHYIRVVSLEELEARQ